MSAVSIVQRQFGMLLLSCLIFDVPIWCPLSPKFRLFLASMPEPFQLSRFFLCCPPTVAILSVHRLFFPQCSFGSVVLSPVPLCSLRFLSVGELNLPYSFFLYFNDLGFVLPLLTFFFVIMRFTLFFISSPRCVFPFPTRRPVPSSLELQKSALIRSSFAPP